jgi:hypothetical protein
LIEGGREGMMVRLVPCGVRECRQAVIDRESERQRDHITNKEGREGMEGRTIV